MQVEDLKTWFHKRGYPDYLIKEQVEKNLRLTPTDENNGKKVNSVSLIVTYNPSLIKFVPGDKKKPSVIIYSRIG